MSVSSAGREGHTSSPEACVDNDVIILLPVRPRDLDLIPGQESREGFYFTA